MRTEKLNGFDAIAWLYDPLAQLVFGDKLRRAQTAFLHHIVPGSRVLILGGGTGAIAQDLLVIQPPCHITFVDASQAMIRRAQKRLENETSIEYIHGTVDALPHGARYDIVITPFYLDMFPEELLPMLVQNIRTHLSESARWFVADFCSPERVSQQVLLSVMYGFFRATTGIQARSLPNWHGVLTSKGWMKVESVRINGFIEGAVYTC